MSKVTTSVQRAVYQATIVFQLVYCPVDNTLFEVSPEIRCLVRQSLLLLKSFFITSIEN